MKPFGFRWRTGLALALFSTSIACLVYADSKGGGGADASKECNEIYDNCVAICDSIEGDSGVCRAKCLGDWEACLINHGMDVPKSGPPRPVGQVSPPPKSHPTITPRPGPGQVSPPPRSHPTPTPRKGPDKVGTSTIGRASPTPKPSGLGHLQKSGKKKPSPSPHPSSTPR